MIKWHHPRFSFEKGLWAFKRPAFGGVQVVGGSGLPAQDPQEALLRWLCCVSWPLPLSFAFVGILRLCSVWWQQSGLFHDVRQDFSSELVEAVWWGLPAPRVFKILRTWNSLQLELGAAPVQSRTAVDADTTCGVLFHLSFLLLSYQFIPILFFSLLKNKSRLQCSWCCSDSTLRCYQCLRLSIRPESKHLSFSSRIPCLWTTLSHGCLKAETMTMPLVLEVGTRRCEVVV